MGDCNKIDKEGITVMCFSGEPKTKWLTNSYKSDRDMLLLEDFYFIDPNGRQWNANEGEVIDGASIPRFLWSLIGSPYTRDYRRASIVHDIAIRGLQDTSERKLADKMFYHACRYGGCSIFESWVLYLGVRIGSWMSGGEDDYDEFELLFRKPVGLERTKLIRYEFAELVEKLRTYNDETEFDVIDSYIEEWRKNLVSN